MLGQCLALGICKKKNAKIRDERISWGGLFVSQNETLTGILVALQLLAIGRQIIVVVLVLVIIDQVTVEWFGSRR